MSFIDRFLQFLRPEPAAAGAVPGPASTAAPVSTEEGVPAGIPVLTVGAGRQFSAPLGVPPVPTRPVGFDACLRFVLEHEGGYVDDPADNGGATNMGITIATLRTYRGRAVSKQEVRDLGLAEAAAIYRAGYWGPTRCAELPPGVDLMVFDFAVNAGPGRSVRMLQRVVGVEDDGVFGRVTLAAALAVKPAVLVTRLGDARLEYYRLLENYPRFGKGWTRRTEEARVAGLAMVG